MAGGNNKDYTVEVKVHMEVVYTIFARPGVVVMEDAVYLFGSAKQSNSSLQSTADKAKGTDLQDRCVKNRDPDLMKAASYTIAETHFVSQRKPYEYPHDESFRVGGTTKKFKLPSQVATEYKNRVLPTNVIKPK